MSSLATLGGQRVGVIEVTERGRGGLMDGPDRLTIYGCNSRNAGRSLV